MVSSSTHKKQKKQRRNKNTKMNSDSDRTSGALTTSQHHVDVGGALIHGIENNPIYHITSQMGVPMHMVSSYCLLMNSDGWPFDPKVDEKSSNFFNECLDATFALAENDRDSKESFGVLFERVCREKSSSATKGNGRNDNGTSLEFENGSKPLHNKNWETPLLKWHRANLELPSGASFYDLGHTWNEDEPYGFDGDHAAVEPSWKLVMEHLADGLNILDNSPVTEIRIVLPNGTTPPEIPKATKPVETTSVSTEGVGSNEVSNESPNGTIGLTKVGSDQAKPIEVAIKYEAKDESAKELDGTKPDIPSTAVPPIRKSAKRARRARKEFDAGVDAVEKRRFSRRTRNIGIEVRRSSRSTKGVIHRLNYDKNWDEKSRRKRQKKGKRNKSVVDGVKKPNDDREFATSDWEKNSEENRHEEVIDFTPSSVVQVTVQDGTVLEADALVCTLPLGILKLSQKDPSHVRFSPSLDVSKKEAIENLGCGLLNKCVISFPTAFWQDSDFLGQAQSQHSYLVLNAAKYTQKPILIFMYGGDFAKDIETWTDREIISDCLEVLRKICGIREIPAPIDYCITRWGKEEYSRMAFTCIPPGVDGAKTLMAMSQPVYDPVLPEKPLIMFAGEHTTPYHPSTMHGAFLSGIREAYRFDLYMEPSLNGETSFDDNIHVYKHTFPIKRVYKRTRVKSKPPKVSGKFVEKRNGALISSQSNADDNVPPNAKTHSRRRGFGGMTLRKRPDTNPPSGTTNDTAANGTTSVPASSSRKNGTRNGIAVQNASRRSQRSVGSARNSIRNGTFPGSKTKMSDAEDALNHTAMVSRLKSESKAKTDRQEERTLLRALESYGPGSHSLVRSHLLPVYGSTRRRSLKHIDDRWKRSLLEGKRNGGGDDDAETKRSSTTASGVAESWKAEHAVSDNWDTHLSRIAADAAKEAFTANKSDGGSKGPRRSQRGSKRRSIFDA